MNAETKPLNTLSTRRRKLPWVVGGLLIFGFVIMLRLPSGDGFEVNGVPFRVWVAQHPDFQIQDSLAAVGTNAIPHLIRILREPSESPRAAQVKTWIWKQLPRRLQLRFYQWYPVARWQLKRTALFGLRFLGPEAEAALPDVIQFGRAETNKMVRAGALVAALQIAPEAPETFNFWREEWNGTNYSHHDLATYLHAARFPVAGAVPLLLQDAQKQSPPISVLEAFEYYGEAARPAVPHILRVAESETCRGNMTKVLKRLGPAASDAVPAMTKLLSDTNTDAIAGTLLVLKSIGTAARPAASGVQALLTNNDSTVRMLAAATLAQFEGNPEMAVPVLLDVIEGRLLPSAKAHVPVDLRQESAGLVTSGPQAATLLLGELGPEAQAALPTLERLLENRNEVTRILAAQAIWRIGRKNQFSLPLLVKVLDAQQPPSPGPGPTSPGFVLIMAIEVLEEMGTEAKEAIPALERVREFSIPARRAANSALARIRAKSP